MSLVDREHEANSKTVAIKSKPRMTLTFSCGNLFTMSQDDRAFVLGILETIERYEQQQREESI